MEINAQTGSPGDAEKAFEPTPVKEYYQFVFETVLVPADDTTPGFIALDQLAEWVAITVAAMVKAIPAKGRVAYGRFITARTDVSPQKPPQTQASTGPTESGVSA